MAGSLNNQLNANSITMIPKITVPNSPLHVAIDLLGLNEDLPAWVDQRIKHKELAFMGRQIQRNLLLARELINGLSALQLSPSQVREAAGDKSLYIADGMLMRCRAGETSIDLLKQQLDRFPTASNLAVHDNLKHGRVDP
ncbi:hypothetical protein Nepgr_015162 [Nepenthes gracilis]|uniref:Uncharacterized protein n=1 Tax=Nepenthes gracilis TaxID=150966 RepID=A0AAD3XR22_NEPGR|nr:hypothetical protein Nepgr_015162 [Nepenthes gracilis]